MAELDASVFTTRDIVLSMKCNNSFWISLLKSLNAFSASWLRGNVSVTSWLILSRNFRIHREL